MISNRKLTALTALVAITTLVPTLASGGASSASGAQVLPGDTSVPFWPHETGVLVGTSETFADMREDGSYYDPSLQRRVPAEAVR